MVIAGSAHARSPAPTPSPPAPPPSIAAYAAEVDEADADLHAITSPMRSHVLDDNDLTAEIAALPAISAKLDDVLSNLTPRMQAADARIAQLGPAPGPGQPPEDVEIAQARQRLVNYREAIDTEVKQARLLSVELDQVGHLLSARRRKLFAEHLWAHSRTLFAPALWRDAGVAAPGDLAQVGRALTAEQGRVAAVSRNALALLPLGAALVFALLLLGPGRVLLDRIGLKRARRSDGSVTRLDRSGLAVWRTGVAALSPLVALSILRAALTNAGALTPVAQALAASGVVAVTFATLIEGLGRALLSPRHGPLRLTPLANTVARRVAAYPGLLGLTAALASLVVSSAITLKTSAPVSNIAQYLSLLVELGVVAAALVALGRERSEPVVAPPPEAPSGASASRTPWRLAVVGAWLGLGAAIVAMTAGYLALASFVTRELVWIGLVLAALYLLLRFIDDLVTAACSPEGAFGAMLQVSVGLSAIALEQLGVILSGLGRLALFLLAWAAILAPFRASAGEAFGRFTSSDLVLRVGQVSISPGAVAGALAVFLLGLGATRVVRSWLEASYLPKTRMDIGVQSSLASGVTYLGALVAIVLACAYMGLSLDRIALFASALSVGIGFGLQSVIGNFVSGLVLLAERPIKVGDWIAIGDLEGDVRRINVRATEIEMQDRSKLIVPNSDLISKTVRNVTHAGSLGRVKIVFRLGGDSDPLVVRELVLGRLMSHPEVLHDPAPGFYMNDVRDGALEFTALAYLASPRHAYRVKSELLFQIVPDLRARKIALANSSPVVNVALADRTIEPTPEA